MFDRIAPRYDRMNRLMTLGLDQRWRRAAIAAIGIGQGDRVLDLACGTGDLAELCAARGATVIGVDFAGEWFESLIPLEMMACGLPVVDLDLENVTAVFPRDVLALAPPTPHAVADVIERLLVDEPRRQRQADAATRHIRHLSWEKSARQVERALQHALQPAVSAVPGRVVQGER